MRTIKIKTIDVQAKEWFDKVNGNSYFSAQATINFGLTTQKTVFIPMQYGYGDSYRTHTIEQLQKDGILPNNGTLSHNYFSDNKIIIRATKQTKCLKRDVNAWGSN